MKFLKLEFIDPEIKAMAAAIKYMENADEKSRRRFMLYLHHRYWNNGCIEFDGTISDGSSIPVNIKID